MSQNNPPQNKVKFSIPGTPPQKQAELLQHVRHLFDQGFNLVPLQAGEKKALNSWKAYQDRRQTWQELTRMNWQGGLAGINGVSGLRSFDFDHLDLFGPVGKLLEVLGLPVTYEWTPRSGNGYHVWVRCEEEVILDNIPKTRYVGYPIDPEKYPFKQLELRLKESYTVLPPSVHPSGKAYEWKYKDALPKEDIAVVTAQQLAAAFFALVTLQSPKRAATRIVTPVSYSIPSTLQAKPHAFTREEQVSARVDTIGESFAARRAQGIAPTMDEFVRSNVVRQRDQVQALPKYAAKILQNELARLRNTLEGERNNQLYKSAYALGRWIAGGLFDKRLVKEELTRVAEGIGLEQPEIQATIRSGLEAGMQKPRTPSLSEVEDVEDVGDKASRSSTFARLLGFSADDVGNARSVRALYGTHILYTDEYSWLYWNGTYWERNIAAVRRKVIKTLEIRRFIATVEEKEGIVKATVGDMKRITGAMSALMPYCTAKISEFDNDPDLLNTLDGVVNLRTGKIEPHHPAQRFTCCVPVGVGNEEDAKPLVAFLLDALGSKEMVDYLQMAVGYSLTGHTREEILFYLYGPSRSGKGTFTELLLALLLHPLAEEVDFNTFTAKRDGNDQNFDLAALKPARLVIASESNRNQSLNPAKIKQLTGGNRVQAAFKHRDMFSYKPQYKIWLVSNHPLNGDVDDDALWGRVHIINFPHSHLHCEDMGLKERLKSPEVLRGVLYWAIQGAMKWYQAGRLPVPEQIKQSVAEHRAQLDTVQMWLDDKAELVEGAWTPSSIVVSNYIAWCAENNYEPKRGKALTASLKHKGCVPGEKQYWNGVQTRGVLGMRIL